MRKLLKYLLEFQNKVEFPFWVEEELYVSSNNDVTRSKLIKFLISNNKFRGLHFLSFLIKLKNFKKDSEERNILSEIYLEEKINELIDLCISRDYILVLRERLEHFESPILKITPEGKWFIRWLPFLNTVLKEYGYIITFLVGGGIATLFGLFYNLYDLLLNNLF